MRLKMTWTGTGMGLIPGRWGTPSTVQCPDSGGLPLGGRACSGMLNLPWWTWRKRRRNDKSPRWVGLRIAGGQRWSKLYLYTHLMKNTRIAGGQSRGQRWTNFYTVPLLKNTLKVKVCIMKFGPQNNHGTGQIMSVSRYHNQLRSQASEQKLDSGKVWEQG